MPSATSPIQVCLLTRAFRNSFGAESFTRSQWRSRSGVTPSKARAPSNTEEPSQAAWLRGPKIPILPSCQSHSKKVQVLDQSLFEPPFPCAIGLLLMQFAALVYGFLRVPAHE